MSIRKTLDQMTSNDLDALHERVAAAETEADDSVTAAAHLTTLVGRRSEKADRAAKRQRQRADIAETELHVLRSGLRAIGADPTQIQNLWAQIRLRNRQWRKEKQRAEQAEATIARIAALAEEHPAGIDTALIHAELDTTGAPGPAATPATDTEKTTRVFAALHRSAEQDVTRVINLYERWVKAGPPPLGVILARWWDTRLVELHDAILPTADQTEEH